MSDCRLFVPYRTLGLVSNEIPLITRYIKRRNEIFIVTSIGNAFHTYSESKLGLVSVGNAHTSPIQCMTADSYHVYTAAGKIIYAWRRGTELKHKYEGHSNDILFMLPFGPHLLSIDKGNILKIWDIKMEELYSEMEFPKNFTISSIMHPAKYHNKILLGSNQGRMQLWNIRTDKLICSFSGWGSKITVLEQSTAEDVIAVGLADGRIILHNIREDKTCFEFQQDWGEVTAISFRTDEAVMVTGSLFGHIAVWNLMERKLSSQINKAHRGPVTGLKCFPNDPRMVSSSPDNTLKMWIFDLSDGGARLLKLREGHSEPPIRAKFHGNLGDCIITGGEDSTLRLFSTVVDNLNCSLGMASYNRKASKRKGATVEYLKMPPIIDFTTENSQEKPWDNVAALHRGRAVVTTWSTKNKRMGDHLLLHNRFKREKAFKNSVATCAELTVCGNFIIIGYSTGHMDKFNIQSGIYRGCFGDPIAHSNTIRGVVTDGFNSVALSGGQEGLLKWWKIGTCVKIHEINLEEGIIRLYLNRDSGLLAIALSDWTINIVDIETKGVLRKFSGHINEVTDIILTPDSSWMISSSLDRSIRTWDLPSGNCIDYFLVPVPASSLSISPTGDFLATIHADLLGVCLWANRQCFQHISLYPLPDTFSPPLIPLPSTAISVKDELVPESFKTNVEEEENDEMEIDTYVSPDQISDELITLALLPTSRWLNLMHLDVIKKRNKPIEPPKALKAAPFFLQTVPGLEFKFATPEDKINDQKSKITSITTFEMITRFGETLKDEDYNKALKMLLEMGPSAIDLEIKALDPDTGGSELLMLNFLNMIYFALQKCLFYEAVQGYFSLFLKVHSGYVIKNSDCQNLCRNILNAQKASWHVIRKNFNESLCLLSYFKNSAVLDY